MILQVLLFTLIPVATTLAGGVVAALRPPGPKVESIIQHFAAGVVFAAAAGELLPDVLHQRSVLAVMVGFVLGVGVMLSNRFLKTQPKEGSRWSYFYNFYFLRLFPSRSAWRAVG